MFKLPTHYLTRAKHILRAWGEHVRVDRAAPNGLQASSIWRGYNELIEFEVEQLEKIIKIMLEIKENNRESYDWCHWRYVEQNQFPNNKAEREKLWEKFRKIHTDVFEKMWPHVVDLERTRYEFLQNAQGLKDGELQKPRNFYRNGKQYVER